MKLQISARIKIILIIYLIFISSTIVFGFNLAHFKTLKVDSPISWGLLTLLVLMLCFIIQHLIVKVNNRIKLTARSRPGILQNRFRALLCRPRSCFLLALIFLLTWIPYFIACYPGLFVYDAFTQTHYSIGLGTINSFHPLAHTYLMSFCIQLGEALFNSQTIGFGCYTFVQMIVMSFFLSLTVRAIFKLSNSCSICIATILLFALHPVFPILAISATKDSIFSAAFCCSVSEYIVVLFNQKTSNAGKMSLGISLFTVGLFRNNGYYVALLAVLALAIIKHADYKTYFSFIIALALALILFCQIIPSKISAQQSNVAEILGVPIQQLCRVITNESNTLSDEEVEDIESLIPTWNYYNPKITDPVKFSGNTTSLISDNINQFLNTWLRVGYNHKRTYLDAFALITEGYWNPFFEYSASDVTKAYLEFDPWHYDGNGSAYRDQDTNSEFYPIEAKSEWIFIDSEHLWPDFENLVHRFCYNHPWDKIPMVSLVTSCWASIAALLAAICLSFIFQKRSLMIGLIALPLAYYATSLLGPCFLVRYATPFFAITPVLLGTNIRLLRDHINMERNLAE